MPPPPSYGGQSYGTKASSDIEIKCVGGHDLHIGLSWDFFHGMPAVDLDVQCVLLDSRATVVEAVYYNQTYAANGALTHSGDEKTGETHGEDEFINADLDKLDPNIKFVILVISCYKEGTFKNVETAHVVFKDNEKVLHQMAIGSLGAATSVIPGYIYRDENTWKFHGTRIRSNIGRNFQEIGDEMKNALAEIAPWLHDCPMLSYEKVFNMKKGDVVAIMTDALTFKLGLGWEAEGGCDLDGSCILMDKNNNIISTVMYNNLQAFGVIHSGDNTTGDGDGDDEIITVRLRELPADVCQLFFTVNMYSDGKTFRHNVYDAYVRMMCGNPLKVVAKFALSPDEGGEVSGRCLVFARLFCTPAGWKFEAIGKEAQGRTATSSKTVTAVKSAQPPAGGLIPCSSWSPNSQDVQADQNTNWNSLRLPPPTISAGRSNNRNNAVRNSGQQNGEECCVML